MTGGIADRCRAIVISMVALWCASWRRRSTPRLRPPPARSSSSRPPPPASPSRTSTARRASTTSPEMMGAGVALFDYDNDGDLDVFLVQGGPLRLAAAPRDRRASEPAVSQRPGGRRRQRALRFTDVTDGSGLGTATYGMGVAAGDYDNDGDLDLYVTPSGPKRCIGTTATARSPTSTATAGVSDARWSTSAAFVDYDRDGGLDLFVANYLDFTHRRQQDCATTPSARPTTAARAPIARCPTGCTATRATAVRRRRPSRPASARPTAPASASRPATTTATAGWTSTSPTTRRRTSCG